MSNNDVSANIPTESADLHVPNLELRNVKTVTNRQLFIEVNNLVKSFPDKGTEADISSIAFVANTETDLEPLTLEAEHITPTTRAHDSELDSGNDNNTDMVYGGTADIEGCPYDLTSKEATGYNADLTIIPELTSFLPAKSNTMQNYRKKKRAKKRKCKTHKQTVFSPLNLLCQKLRSTQLCFEITKRDAISGNPFWQAKLTVENVDYIVPGYSKKSARQNAAAVCLETMFHVNIGSMICSSDESIADVEYNKYRNILFDTEGTSYDTPPLPVITSTDVVENNGETNLAKYFGVTDDISIQTSTEAIEKSERDPVNALEYFENMKDIADFRRSITNKTTVGVRSQLIFESFLWRKYTNTKNAEDNSLTRCQDASKSAYFATKFSQV